MNESTRTPAVIGFLLTGAAILTLGFLVNRDGASSELDGVPPIRVLAPETGDTTTNPVTLVFQTPAPLELGASGWAASDLHLHIMVDDREIMPAAADIEAGEDAFTWTLPPLEAGERRLYLTWAGRHHGNLRGTTDTVTVIVP